MIERYPRRMRRVKWRRNWRIEENEAEEEKKSKRKSDDRGLTKVTMLSDHHLSLNAHILCSFPISSLFSLIWSSQFTFCCVVLSVIDEWFHRMWVLKFWILSGTSEEWSKCEETWQEISLVYRMCTSVASWWILRCVQINSVYGER